MMAPKCLQEQSKNRPAVWQGGFGLDFDLQFGNNSGTTGAEIVLTGCF
jgi:hypothetical protein